MFSYLAEGAMKTARRASYGAHTFAGEIEIRALSIPANRLIPPRIKGKNDAGFVGETDMYVRQLYTLVRLADRQCKVLMARHDRLIRKYVNSKEPQKTRIGRLVPSVERELRQAVREHEAIDNLFWVEACRRMPQLDDIEAPLLASDWCFYGEEVLYDPFKSESRMVTEPEVFVWH